MTAETGEFNTFIQYVHKIRNINSAAATIFAKTLAEKTLNNIVVVVGSK